jgi:hypothetical protein
MTRLKYQAIREALQGSDISKTLKREILLSCERQCEEPVILDNSEDSGSEYGLCPDCARYLSKASNPNFCSRCGKRIIWNMVIKK